MRVPPPPPPPPPRGKSVVRWTDCLNMTIAVDWDVNNHGASGLPNSIQRLWAMTYPRDGLMMQSCRLSYFFQKLIWSRVFRWKFHSPIFKILENTQTYISGESDVDLLWCYHHETRTHNKERNYFFMAVWSAQTLMLFMKIVVGCKLKSHLLSHVLCALKSIFTGVLWRKMLLSI